MKIFQRKNDEKEAEPTPAKRGKVETVDLDPSLEQAVQFRCQVRGDLQLHNILYYYSFCQAILDTFIVHSYATNCVS